MQLFESLQTLRAATAATIGTFDGVHRGHAALVARLRSEAAARGLQTAVLTFRDMPYFHFYPDQCSRLLTLPDEKAAAFAALKIDHLFLLPFDASIAQLSADEFITELVQKLKLKLLVVGPDFALGKNRAGDVPALRQLGKAHGFELVVLGEKIEDAGEAISSTRVRQCVEAGEIEVATRLLGRAFEISGEVVPGQQLGRKIGVPTINIAPHSRKVVPARGIYAVRATLESTPYSGRTFPAALSIGVRPTVGDELAQTIEFHVIDEEIHTPPSRAKLQIIARLRDEQKFDSLDALVVQMKNDIVCARRILA